MKKLFYVPMTLVIFAAMIGTAIAQAVTDTVVQIPIGTWADYVLPAAGAIALAAVVWLISYLPAPVVAILKTAQVEQILQRAIDFAINMVQGATKDRVLEVDVGNAVVKQAADYVIKYGPKWLIDFLGGETGIRDRIIARLDISPKAGMEPSAVIAGAQAIPGTIPTAPTPKT